MYLPIYLLICGFNYNYTCSTASTIPGYASSRLHSSCSHEIKRKFPLFFFCWWKLQFFSYFALNFHTKCVAAILLLTSCSLPPLVRPSYPACLTFPQQPHCNCCCCYVTIHLCACVWRRSACVCALSPRGSYVPRLGLYSSTRTAHMRVCVWANERERRKSQNAANWTKSLFSLMALVRLRR